MNTVITHYQHYAIKLYICQFGFIQLCQHLQANPVAIVIMTKMEIMFVMEQKQEMVIIFSLLM